MSYTIVYDRKFIRLGDRYIPFCLFGSNNCTQTNYSTGKEIRERSWDIFGIDDEKLPATAEEIMADIRAYYDKDDEEYFVFHSSWLTGKQVVKFYENGIKEAVTPEEISNQAHSSLHVILSGYMRDEEYDTCQEDERWKHTHYEVVLDEYVNNTEDLVAFIKQARACKQNYAGNSQPGLNIHISAFMDEPLKVYARKSIDAPCVAKGKYGYVQDISGSLVKYTRELKEAKVFKDSADAELAISQWRGDAFKIIRKDTISEAKRPRNVVLSYLRNESGNRQYALKLSKTTLTSTYLVSSAKRFTSEREALAWWKKYIEGRFNGVSDPKAEVLSNA